MVNTMWNIQIWFWYIMARTINMWDNECVNRSDLLFVQHSERNQWISIDFATRHNKLISRGQDNYHEETGFSDIQLEPSLTLR